MNYSSSCVVYYGVTLVDTEQIHVTKSLHSLHIISQFHHPLHTEEITTQGCSTYRPPPTTAVMKPDTC